ncbi:MAG: hypothetical protein JF590_02760 [Gemmatimonadetes bacterium]|nr:hypothetical protein [Gemmatimonadota bacterium]
MGGVNPWTKVVAGGDFTCATKVPSLTGGVGIYCWGNNDRHQLGEGSSDTASAVPVLVLQTDFVGELVAGDGFACATVIISGGAQETVCWGANDHGQLGRGTISDGEAIPMPVSGAQVPDLDRVQHMAAAADHICGTSPAVGPRLICWGRNDHGQLGNGHTGDVSFPSVVDDQY